MRRRVLIIDDDPFVGEALTERLQAMGYEASAVSDGASGLAVVADAEGGNPVRLILLDLNMPGMDGLTVLRELQVRHRRIPVIAMSASPLYEGREQAMKAGAFDYLEKPFDGQVLITKIHRAIGCSRDK